VRDCLEEAMDFDGLAAVLTRIHADEIRLVARDTVEPSPLSHDILNAKPYAFLDDAPLEERRTQAVYTRRAGDVAANDLGALDLAAIVRVREEERPDPRDADELHDALLTIGFLTETEGRAMDFEPLVRAKRATFLHGLWIAAERLPELLAIHSNLQPSITAPPSRQKSWTREAALIELIRGRMALLGPTTATALAQSLGIDQRDVDAALLALESEGVILRGTFETRGAQEWCDRRLLARIHRYTIHRLRAEIEPVNAADFMRFLFVWQHVATSAKLRGIEGLQAVLGQLDGFEVAASGWERSVLPARVDAYEPSLLDMLCLTGEVGWARLSPATSTVVSATPIALFLRANANAWQSLRDASALELSEAARSVLETLRTRGASFARDLGSDGAIGELVSAGLIASDGFAGLRALIAGSHERQRANLAGRWSVLSPNPDESSDDALETQARTLLRRYGIIFRRLLTREPNAPPWRELARVYRRLEARGEIRGGRFVRGMSGEQFALPEAIERLREIRRDHVDGRLLIISAADPLNLTGIITEDERIRAVAGTRIAYRDGIAVSVMEGEYVRPLVDLDTLNATTVATALAGRRVPVGSGWVGRTA
jgi:ATP-dependent Lhr-like helicase